MTNDKLPAKLHILSLTIARIVLILAVVCSLSADAASAQSIRWESPTRLYATENSIDDLLLLTDATGRVHLLWSEFAEFDDESSDGETSGSPAIVYMVLENGEWSKPADVVAQMSGRMNDLSGLVDPYGRLHLIYSDNGDVHYVRSQRPTPTGAPFWRSTQTFAGIEKSSGHLSLDAGGQLNLLFGGLDIGLQRHRSDDLGESWSAGDSVTPLPPNGQLSGPPFILNGAADTGYLAWDQRDPMGGTTASYFGREDENGTWGEFSLVASPPPTTTLLSMAQLPDASMHLLFSGAEGTGGRYHIWSPDRGLGWSDRIQIVGADAAPRAGTGGLAADSAGLLHAAFGAQENTVVGYSFWNGVSWSAWANIAAGVTDRTLDHVNLATASGNQLIASWTANDNEIWIASAQSNLPPVVGEYQPLPLEGIDGDEGNVGSSDGLPAAAPLAAAAPAGQEQPMPTSRVLPAGINDRAEGLTMSSSLLLATALLPISLILLVLLISRLGLRRSS
ncbi:MAG: exo-alpha-sialidase [Caldilineaceae bacterium]|nr:exo-alpha-sialidase [Caldilineaceae bacterium]